MNSEKDEDLETRTTQVREITSSCQQTGKNYDRVYRICRLGRWFLLNGVNCKYNRFETDGTYACMKKWA